MLSTLSTHQQVHGRRGQQGKKKAAGRTMAWIALDPAPQSREFET